MYVCTYVCTYVSLFTYAQFNMCAYIYIYVYIHTHEHACYAMRARMCNIRQNLVSLARINSCSHARAVCARPALLGTVWSLVAQYSPYMALQPISPKGLLNAGVPTQWHNPKGAKRAHGIVRFDQGLLSRAASWCDT